MAIDPGGYRQENSRVARQRYSAAPEQKSAGTGSCPCAPRQKRLKSYYYYYYYYYYYFFFSTLGSKDPEG